VRGVALDPLECDDMTTNDALLSVENLVVEYPVGRGRKVHAVSDVSFDVQAGETLGVVGESGVGSRRPARPSSSSAADVGVGALRRDRPREARW